MNLVSGKMMQRAYRKPSSPLPIPPLVSAAPVLSPFFPPGCWANSAWEPLEGEDAPAAGSGGGRLESSGGEGLQHGANGDAEAGK